MFRSGIFCVQFDISSENYINMYRNTTTPENSNVYIMIIMKCTRADYTIGVLFPEYICVLQYTISQSLDIHYHTRKDTDKILYGTMTIGG